jgi:hypothetical protein
MKPFLYAIAIALLLSAPLFPWDGLRSLPPGFGLERNVYSHNWRFTNPNGGTGVAHWWRWEAVHFAWTMYHLDQEWKEDLKGWRDAK